MKKIACLTVILLTLQSFGQDKVLFFQTNWGNKLSLDAFCERAKKSGFDGVEMGLPYSKEKQIELKNILEKYDLKIILTLATNKRVSFEKSLAKYEEKLHQLAKWNPVLINSHTGNDFFTAEQNTAFILIGNKLSKKYNIKILHETHRASYSYSLHETQKYIHAIPDLRLTLDNSHWMVVHESLFYGKDAYLKDVIERTDHIHARVGHPEGPQVNDPEAPEWKKALDRHLDIWEQTIRKGWKENDGLFTVTSEFGAPDYLQTLPYTRTPVTDQWKANVFIMKAIKERMNLE